MIFKKDSVILFILIIILLATSVFFMLRYRAVQSELVAQRAAANNVNVSARVLNFTSLFIEKVLKAKGEVSPEDRSNLEAAVKDLNDAQIFDQWNKFINSGSETQAQEEVKNLLSLLVSKMKE